MSADSRYYYVDAQNQAAGPISMAGLSALKAAGTVTDATLVVVEGGAEWVAFSTLRPGGSAPGGPGALRGPGAAAPSASPAPAAQPSAASPASASVASATTEPVWASQLTQKMDRLIATMEKLVVSLEKSRPPAAVAPAPATAALHAEKINLNPVPKPGIAASGTAPAPGVVAPRPATTPAMVAKPAGLPVTTPRPGVSTALTPLAVPANAQKSALPLPALGKAPGPAPAGLPQPAALPPVKGNIFSKFLKK